MSVSISITKNKLRDLYEKKKLTTYEIADIYNCCQATVWKRLKFFDVKRFVNGRRSLIVSKSKLRDLYVKQQFSSRKIAKLYRCAYSTIDYKIKDYGFPKRSLAKSHIIYPRKNFDGSKTDKAYLIGFAMGDLRVRKKYPNSETINVDCGSTKKEQVILISELFKPYGRVWVSKPNKKGATQVECFLNDSFNFLLKKRILIDLWIIKSKKYFWAFLAGFTDAEGCISITHKGLAFYSLGNYNSQLLSQIRNQLLKIGIESPKLTEGKTKGYIGKEGYANNQNYWSLRLNRKIHLLKLFDLIDSYLKHPAKIKGIKRAKQNIKLRNIKFGNLKMN